MHYSLNKLYNYLTEKGNVLTGRLELFTLSRKELNNLHKCGITITTTEITESNSVKKRTYDFLGFAQRGTNKDDDKSKNIQINAFFRGSPLWRFEFGFNGQILHGTYQGFIGRIEGYEDFTMKEIETIEVRFKKSEEEIDWDSTPCFTIIEGFEQLNRSLDNFFKDNSSFSLYTSNNPKDSTVIITTKNDLQLPMAKLEEIVKQNNLKEDLLGYDFNQILVRSENPNKIKYVLEL